MRKAIPPVTKGLRTVNFLPIMEDVLDEVHKFTETHATDSVTTITAPAISNQQHVPPVDLVKDIHSLLTEPKPVSVKTTKVKEMESEEPEPVADHELKHNATYRYGAQKGILICNGEKIDSEVVYWKIVPGDNEFESPITPHHGLHHDRYLTFEYDNGGWNNIRMGVEALIVLAHAMGRTLVIPPQQHLYLLGESHKDKHDAHPHDEMGFEDFFDINLLRSHQGFHVLTMEQFLQQEAITGGLKGMFPPKNDTKLWGSALWRYLNHVADAKPEWMGKFVAFPGNASDYDNITKAFESHQAQKRLMTFGGERSPEFYDQKLREAHHLHFPAHERHRLLQHHYAFAFFADPKLQSFYKRYDLLYSYLLYVLI